MNGSREMVDGYVRPVGQRTLPPDALREAALRWTSEESGIDPKDPIFDIALGRRKAQDWGKCTERASREVDETLYGK